VPVTILEFVKIKDTNGQEHEGIAIADGLTAIKTEDTEEGLKYGVALGITKVRTKIICDNPDCINSTINEEFRTVPKTLEFDETGQSNSAAFIKDVAEVVITSDYKGVRMAYCTPECCAKHLRKESRNLIVMR
jgi:hypothetical protein